MKKQTQIINKSGKVVAVINDDDDAIVPDGYGIRVPMMLQDSAPTAGHRPGYVYDAGDNEAAARDAYAEMKVRMSNAWRTGKAVSWTEPARPIHNARPALGAVPGPWVNKNPDDKPPDVTMDEGDHARAAYEARIQNAWKTKPATVVSEPTRHTSDAAPNSAAAYAALVRRTENAWRTGGT